MPAAVSRFSAIGLTTGYYASLDHNFLGRFERLRPTCWTAGEATDPLVLFLRLLSPYFGDLLVGPLSLWPTFPAIVSQYP
jgi:hypothetical protein